MKRILSILTVLAVLVFASSALAAQAMINVSANVVGTCKVTTTGGVTLSFGDLTLDDTGGAPAVTLPLGSAVVDFWCTRGATFSVTDDGGQNNNGQFRLASETLTTTEYIPYSFQYSPTGGTGQGPQNGLQIEIGASLATDSYADASVDTYSDTVVLTITP